MNRLNTIQYEKAHADIFCFDNDTAVKEYHAMIHVDDATMDFPQQLQAIMDAYSTLVENTLLGARCIFKRYFLSDSANQEEDRKSTRLNSSH